MRIRVLLILVLLAAAVAADSWAPWAPRLAVSPGGRHYLVARETVNPRGRVEFELCRRRAGAGRIAGPVRRDPRDRLLVRGVYAQLPVEIRVLDGEPAAVFFENYGDIGRAHSLALLDARGEVRWRLELEDLFTGPEVRQFVQTSASIWWYAGWWLDERRGKAVLVSKVASLREVDLRTGNVGEPPDTVLLTRIGNGPEAEQKLALEAAAKLRPEGLAEPARAIAADRARPFSLRLRAAVALRAAGGP
ncbi:MAG: hypothetical protein ACE5JG_05680, partial [Planctomycetota bacterium]